MYRVYKGREKQNVYKKFFFFPFLLFISKTHDMRRKSLNLFFDENASLSFLLTLKVYSI